MSGVLATRTIDACPSWCEEPAGHRNVDDDPLEEPSVRTHTAQIGLFLLSVSEGFSEMSIERTRRRFGVESAAELTAPAVELAEDPRFETPAALRQFAADALKAAEWLEAQTATD